MTDYINPKAKLLQHIDRLAELKIGNVPPPVNLEIDLSNRCNLGCRWCHFAHTHTRGPHGNGGKVGDLIDTELVLALLHEAKEYGVRSVTWSGGGEPTLHPDFDQVVQACPLPQGLYTNGTQIDGERAALLKERMEWVYVSLDASMWPALRGSKIVAGYTIRALVDAAGDATIGVGFLLDNKNWRHYLEMMRRALEWEVDYCQYRPAIEPGKSTDWIIEAEHYLSEMGRGIIMLDWDRFLMYRRWHYQDRGYNFCYWSGLQAVVTPDGRVWACCNKRGFDGAELGDLNKEPFADIWERRPLQQVNGDCRMMCRGHIPNLALQKIMEPMAHGEFI